MTKGKTTTRVNLRSGPGTDQPIVKVLDPGAAVTILADTGEWLRIEAGDQEGFVHERFVAQERQAVVAGYVSHAEPLSADIAPPPNQTIKLGPRPTSAEKLVATTWNRLGGLLSALAEKLKFDVGAAVAVFGTESGGKAFGPDGRVVIRFENHYFFRCWGKANQEIFDRHFRYETKKAWTGHQWRPSVDSPFEDVHRDQNSEWRAFTFACKLNDSAAKCSISMGGPQIMGANYADAGFESVEQMFDAFAASEKSQVLAFFDFLQGPETHPRKVIALQKQDWIRFAELYNGPGNAAFYGAKIADLFETFQRLRPRGFAAVV